MKKYLLFVLLGLSLSSALVAQQGCTKGFKDSSFTTGLNPFGHRMMFARITVDDTMILKDFGIMGAGSMDSLEMGLWIYKPPNQSGRDRLGSLVTGSEQGIFTQGPVRLSAISEKVVLPFDYYLGFTTKGINTTGYDTYIGGARDTVFWGLYGFNVGLPQRDYTIENELGYNPKVWIEGECCPRADTVKATACQSYTSASGRTYTQSGYYIDTVMPSSFHYCDSMVVLDLTLSGIDTRVSKAGYSLTTMDSGGTYQWINCSSGSLIPGATARSYTDSAWGDFAVVISKNGCTDTSDCYSISGIGLSELSGHAASVYPNPTTGKIFIEYSGEIESLKAEVYSARGKRVDCSIGKSKRGLQVELPETNGVYILHIQSGQFRATRKVVKY